MIMNWEYYTSAYTRVSGWGQQSRFRKVQIATEASESQPEKAKYSQPW